MMRAPTPAADLYAWHRAAMVDPVHDRHDDEPQCGWYRMRMVKGGPFVPVEIRIEREIDDETGELNSPEKLVALAAGERRNPSLIWTHLTPISRDDFYSLTARTVGLPAMAATHATLDLSQEPMLP